MGRLSEIFSESKVIRRGLGGRRGKKAEKRIRGKAAGERVDPTMLALKTEE